MKNIKRLTLYFVLSVIAVISLAVAVFIGNVNNRQEVFAETSGELVLATTSATATQNSEFSTNVYIEENSNVAGFTFTLNFDSSIVTIVKDKCVNGSSGATINVTDSGVTISYASVYSTNSRLDLVTLVFKVNENTASGTYNSWLNLDSEGFYDAALNDLTVNYKASTLTVSIANIGDVYEDGEINSKDVIYLLQYLANIVDAENINLVNANAYVEDNSDDGTIKVNSRDSIILLQYLAKMDVTIGVGEWTVKTIPTVTTAGTLVRKTAAGIETVALPVLNNTDYICTVKTQSTCASYGVCEYTYTYNGVNYTFEAAGTTLGEHVTSDWTVVQAATCEESGLKHKVCTVCGTELETEAIAATGHTYGEWTVVQAATCEENGIKHKVCTVCGTELETGTIAATGHNYGDWTVSVEPTLTSTGTLVKTCANNSSHKQTASLPALNQTDYTYTLITAATCVTEGKATYSYSKDGQYFAFSVTTAKTAHTEVADVAVAATCTASGYTAGSHCSVCGQIIVEQTVIPAAGHTWDDGTVTTASTCTATGVKSYTCTTCGETKTETIAVLDHDFTTAQCSMCGTIQDGYTAISTSTQLLNIASNMSGKYVLTSDITLSGDWTPIGYSTSSKFYGVLDGNNHSISGLTSTNINYGGVIWTNSGTIKNLTLVSPSFTISHYEDIKETWPTYGNVSATFGSIASINNGTIDSCKVTGKISVTTYNYIGLWFNSIKNGTDQRNDFYNTYYLGGVVGVNYSTVSNCIVSASFTYSSTNYMGSGFGLLGGFEIGGFYLHSNVSVGGIIGYNQGTLKNSTMSGDCVMNSTQTAHSWDGFYNSRTVGVEFKCNFGSLVGNNTSVVSNCYGTECEINTNHIKKGDTSKASLDIAIYNNVQNGIIGYSSGTVSGCGIYSN